MELSPCIQSALRSLPKKVTTWDFVKHLLLMHPEYIPGEVEPVISEIDKKFQGETKSPLEWLEELEKQYPKATLLHTRLVIYGLCSIDVSLRELFPEEIMEIIRKQLY